MTAALAVLAAAQLAASGKGSIKWSWWEDPSSGRSGTCQSEKVKDAHHAEWASAGECLSHRTLRVGDPLLVWGEQLQGSDATVECRDPGSGGVNLNAADDVVVVTYYESSDKSCTGNVVHETNFTGDTCVNGHGNMSNTKFMCSRCQWVFMDESPPPYFVQAIGVFVFLVLCIFLNVYLQDHFDRLLKKLPFMVLPCLAKPAPADGRDDIKSGVLVIIKTHDRRRQACTPTPVTRSESASVVTRSPHILLPSPSDASMHVTSPLLPAASKSLDQSDVRQASPDSSGDRLPTVTAQLSLDIVDLINTPTVSPTDPGYPGDTRSFAATYAPNASANASSGNNTANPAAGRGSGSAAPGAADWCRASMRRSRQLPRDGSLGLIHTVSASTDVGPLYSDGTAASVSPLRRGSGVGAALGSGAGSRRSRPQGLGASYKSLGGSFSLRVPNTTEPRSRQPTPLQQPLQPQQQQQQPVIRGHSNNSNSNDNKSATDQNEIELVEEYSEHGTARSPLMEPLSPNVEGVSNHSISMAPTYKHVCVVCGDETRHGEFNKKNGFKCANCKGKPSNPLLVGCEMVDEELTQLALEGYLGEFATVLAVRTSGSDAVLFVAFRNVQAWIRSAALAPQLAAKKDSELVPQPLYDGDPGARFKCEDPAVEKHFLRFCQTVGFRLCHHPDDTAPWVSIALSGPITCWVNQHNARKVYDFGGPYVRVVDKSEFKEVSKDKWKKWWADFELCVGELMMVKRDEGDVTALECVVSFKGSATLIIPGEACLACTQAEHDSEYLLTPQIVTKRTMMAVFVASAPPLLAAKGLFLMSFFVYSVVSATSDGHGGRANHHSRWEAYEEVYFKLFNSGYPTLMADCGSVTLYFLYSFKPSFQQFVAGVGKPVIITLVLVLGISLPGIVTHALPMVFVYCWLWLPVGLIVYLCRRLVRNSVPTAPEVDREFHYDIRYYEKNHKLYLLKSGLFYLGFRFIAELVAVLFIQTNFNYAIFLYEGTKYLQVVPDEFNSRQFACILEMGMKMASLMW